jgi:thiamine phosphate synthase YjbQ (UPF0047 family)
MGPSLTVPLAEGRLMPGERQQNFLLDYYVEPRSREIIITVQGE